jgi:hypothetical protein
VVIITRIFLDLIPTARMKNGIKSTCAMLNVIIPRRSMIHVTVVFLFKRWRKAAILQITKENAPGSS